MIAPIGGFFERQDPDDGAGGISVLEAWTGDRTWAGFVNARSAFAALVESLPGVTVWLPAFVCSDLVDPSFAGRVRVYPVAEGFVPELAAVETDMVAGDLVLVVAYFGQPVAAAVEAFVRRRPDLRIVEDRAQALDPGPAARDRWVLYSPRKLLGVADGGLLVAPVGASTLPQPSATADEAALWRAAELRHADPGGRDNAVWHAANRDKEAAMAVTAQAMTARSLSILSRTSLESLAGPRRANWRVMDGRLHRWSALPGAAKGVPLGYVIRLEPGARDRVLDGLHAARIFAAVHWPQIAAPAADFPREHGWTRALITLPCDHRYGAAEMARVADRVEALLA